MAHKGAQGTGLTTGKCCFPSYLLTQGVTRSGVSGHSDHNQHAAQEWRNCTLVWPLNLHTATVRGLKRSSESVPTFK